MSLNASPQTSSAPIILEDHEGYEVWGNQVYTVALQLKLVNDLDPTMEYYPDKPTELLAFEVIYWAKTAADYTRKEVKEKGFNKPKPLPLNIDLPYSETLAGGDLAAEEAKHDQLRSANERPATSALRRKANVYNAHSR